MDLVTEQRLARRAAIMSAAREMISEVGYAAVTVRDLAERCRVSVPTLYNQFGGKDGLLGASIEDHFAGVLDNAPLSRAEPGIARLLEIIDQVAMQLCTLSTYHQRLLEAFMSLDTTTSVQQRVAIRLSAAFEAQLKAMSDRRQLASWVIPPLCAEQITAACINAAIVWSSGLLSDSSLTSHMRYSTGLILLGAVRGKSHETVQTRVVAAQKRVARERGAAKSTSRKIKAEERAGSATH